MHMIEFLGVKRVGRTPEGYVLETPVVQGIAQPDGILHGGISAMLAEEAASQGARESIDLDQFTAVGLDLTSTHLLPVQVGDTIKTIASPIRQGGRTQVWKVEQFRQSDGALFNVSQLTVYIKRIAPYAN
ncbi:MAG TPA: PaaI family thioesterase [Slackia equolifaciens]|uniref:PaaI family thioesterase n=1 Tax=Slackia equolifaciens TaxID=498718 RepID=A0A9D2UXS7_9ACTN|nr:PaaI family thioesterase [Slackia equolifaciens]